MLYTKEMRNRYFMLDLVANMDILERFIAYKC